MKKHARLNRQIKEFLGYINRHNFEEVDGYDGYFKDWVVFDVKTVMSIDRRISWTEYDGLPFAKKGVKKLKKYNLSALGYAVITTSYNGYLREEAYRNLSKFDDDYIFYFFYRGMRDNVRKIAEFCYMQMDRMLNGDRVEPAIKLLPYISIMKSSVSNVDLHDKFKSELYSYIKSLNPNVLEKYMSTFSSSYGQLLLFDILSSSNDDESINSIKKINITNSSMCFRIMDYLKLNLSQRDYNNYVFSKNDYYGDIMKLDIYTNDAQNYQKEIRELAINNIKLLKDCNTLLLEKITSEELMHMYKESNNKKYLVGVSLISTDTEELRYCLKYGNRRIAQFAMTSLLNLNRVTIIDWMVFLETSSNRNLNNVIDFILKEKIIIDKRVHYEITSKNRKLGIKISRSLQVYDQLVFLLELLQSDEDTLVLNELHRLIHYKMVVNYIKCSDGLRQKIEAKYEMKKKHLSLLGDLAFYIR